MIEEESRMRRRLKEITGKKGTQKRNGLDPQDKKKKKGSKFC